MSNGKPRNGKYSVHLPPANRSERESTDLALRVSNSCRAPLFLISAFALLHLSIFENCSLSLPGSGNRARPGTREIKKGRRGYRSFWLNLGQSPWIGSTVLEAFIHYDFDRQLLVRSTTSPERERDTHNTNYL